MDEDSRISETKTTSVRRYGTLAILGVLLVLALGWLMVDIRPLWHRAARRQLILEGARLGQEWPQVQSHLERHKFVFTDASTKFGPDPTRFVYVDDVGSHTLGFLRRIGVYEERRAWVILEFDGSNRVKSIGTEYSGF
ncbi:MAG: hypothetical protein ACR2IE_18485 [Candidatus Sumerlaeaceae bacterium]